MILRTLSVLTVLVAMLAPARGLDKDLPVERGPARELVPFVFDRDALKKAPPEFLRDYPACYLHASTSHRIETDGAVETVTHEVIRLNNRKGIDQVGEHRNVSYCPGNEKLTLNLARVFKPDGRSIDVDAKNLQLRDVQTDYQVYDSSKELIISFPGLEVGDVVEVEWTTRGRNPEYAGQFFTRYAFGDDRFPIVSEVFCARAAKEKTLRYGLFAANLLPNPKMQPEIREDALAKTFTWRVDNRYPVVKEDHSPPKEELRPGVAISTFATWDEVAAWERRIRDGCFDCDPELKNIVHDVKQHNKTATAVAHELTKWVRTNIRYVSTGDRHDFTPHAPGFVCKNRFGDCKDGAQLLYVLLKEAGIPAGFVSLSPLGDGQVDPEVPSPLTTHAILHVPIDGKDHWIDTTAAHAGWDFLPYTDCDRVAYIVDEKTIRLTRTPKFTADDNRIVTVTKMTFDAEGDSHNVRTVDYFGQAALAKRDEWVDTSAKERRRLIRGELLDSHSHVQLSDPIEFDETSLHRHDGPARVKFTFDVPNHLHGKEEMSGSVSDNALWGSLLGITIDPERELPIEFKEPFESRHRFIISAPKGFKLEDPPESEEITSKWGTFSVKVDADNRGRRWTIDFKTRLNQTRVEKDDLIEFQKFQEDVMLAFRAELMLKALEDN
jgi:Domain of Unknown Function with PDB structure (DUF3857)/Transglutaminase-like superfamily